MPDYKSMYFILAGQVADAIDLLQTALLTAEDTYVEAPPQPVSLVPADEDEAE